MFTVYLRIVDRNLSLRYFSDICYIVLLGLTFYRERDTLKRVIKNKDKFRKESESANPFFIPTFVYFIFLVITLIITLL